MHNDDTGLVPSLEETLLDPAIEEMGDAVLEVAEVGLDGILQEGVLRDIPILGILAALCKTGASIRERSLIRQTANFLVSYNKGNIPKKKLLAHREMLESDPRKAEEELGRVILLLDRSIERQKAKVLGAFYRHYVNEAYAWSTFVEISEVNERMFVEDYPLLQNMLKGLNRDAELSDKMLYRYQRLESLGLIIDKNMRVEKESLMFVTTASRYNLSPLGKRFTMHME